MTIKRGKLTLKIPEDLDDKYSILVRIKKGIEEELRPMKKNLIRHIQNEHCDATGLEFGGPSNREFTNNVIAELEYGVLPPFSQKDVFIETLIETFKDYK